MRVGIRSPLETYYDHYKESCGLLRSTQKRRNRCFIVLCILEAVSFLMMRNPDFIFGLLNDAATIELKATVQISNGILQTLVWILIAYSLIRYVQDVLYLERGYFYLRRLEERIAVQLEEKEDYHIFNREGNHYLEDYPMVLNFIELFYKFFVPIFFAIINLAHIIQEWNHSTSIYARVCDTFICIATLIIIWFYFFAIHRKITAFFLKFAPIRCIANLLRNWLKEV